MSQSNYMESSTLEKKVDDIDDKVTTVITLLKGNEMNPHDKGMLGEMTDVKARVAQLEKWKDRLVWTVIGMSVPASIGLLEILKKIIIK